jgi:hypothetical protein
MRLLPKSQELRRLRALHLKRHRGQKVFCIGRNKTGTTSLKLALSELGYNIGSQDIGELLVKDYAKKNWKPIIRYCYSAEAFQDAPFSWPYTWLILTEHFPGAKFILTVRDSESWYKSITRFHSKLFADGKRLPTKQDLLAANYRYPGFMWDVFQAVWKTPETDLYNKGSLIQNFERHNNDVIHYFNASKNFLKLDLSERDSYDRLCAFLGKQPLRSAFPHENQTSKIAR